MLGGSNDETFQDPRFETNTAGGWPELLLLVVPFSWLHIVDIQMENEMVAVVIVVIASGVAKKNRLAVWWESRRKKYAILGFTLGSPINGNSQMAVDMCGVYSSLNPKP